MLKLSYGDDLISPSASESPAASVDGRHIQRVPVYVVCRCIPFYATRCHTMSGIVSAAYRSMWRMEYTDILRLPNGKPVRLADNLDIFQ